MTQFKVGDRVRYTGAQSLEEDGKHLSPNDVGKTGTIVGRLPEKRAGGAWDDGSVWCGYFSGNLELIQPTQTSTDRLERLEAFVARVATGLAGNQVVVNNAKALVAEITPPVDSDILTARKIALDYALPAQFNCMTTSRVNGGEADDSDYIQAIVEALRRARKEGNAA